MKNSIKVNALLFISMLSVPALFSQESDLKNKKEGTVKVMVINDENGNVEKVNKEFNLNDKEEIDAFLKEKGIKLNMEELHKHEGKVGKTMKIQVIKEEDVNGEKKEVIINQIRSGDDIDLKSEFEFIINDDSSANHKVLRFHSKDGKGGEMIEDIFVFDEDSFPEGSEFKKVNSFIFISRDKDTDDQNPLSSTIHEDKLSNMPIENLKMYPNPNVGDFSTEFLVTEASDVLLSITDSKGSVVYEKELNNFKGNYKENFDLTNQDAGLYFFNLSIGDERQSNKIIIQ